MGAAGRRDAARIEPAKPGPVHRDTLHGRLEVRLTPRAGVDSLEPPDADGVAHARVRAAPVDGAANEALLRLLATRLGVARSSVSIVTGAQSRN